MNSIVSPFTSDSIQFCWPPLPSTRLHSLVHLHSSLLPSVPLRSPSLTSAHLHSSVHLRSPLFTSDHLRSPLLISSPRLPSAHPAQTPLPIAHLCSSGHLPSAHLRSPLLTSAHLRSPPLTLIIVADDEVEEQDPSMPNPFALDSVTEELHLDDPKKTLRGWSVNL